ncbi:MAG: hypothetical protein V1668_03540 [Patescibacteria group bacterium]
MILLLAVAGMGIVHYFQSCRPDIGKKNTADFLKRDRENKTKGNEEDVPKKLCDTVDSVMPSCEYSDTVVTKLIVGLFQLILIPLRLINNAFVLFIGFLLTAIDEAKRAIHERFKKQNTANGEYSRGLMISFIALIALVVLTMANYQILKIGLPIIWPVDKRPIMNIFGMDVYVVNLLAILMIVAEFTASLLAYEYRSSKGLIVKKSKSTSAVMYLILIILCAAEALLAVYRTQYQTNYNNSLPLYAIGFISFIVPLLAAFCFEKISMYLVWMLAGIMLIVVGILWLPFLIAEIIVSWLLSLALYLLEAISAPFRMAHKATIDIHEWSTDDDECQETEPKLLKQKINALQTNEGR